MVFNREEKKNMRPNRHITLGVRNAYHFTEGTKQRMLIPFTQNVIELFQASTGTMPVIMRRKKNCNNNTNNSENKLLCCFVRRLSLSVPLRITCRAHRINVSFNGRMQ